MSAFEITYIVFAVIIFFGAMTLDDAGAWFGIQAVVATLALALSAYSYGNSPLYETYSRPVQVLSQIEVPDGILIYYLNFVGQSEEIKYTQYWDVQKLKNGGVLHLTTNHAWVNFGPDKETIEVKIK